MENGIIDDDINEKGLLIYIVWNVEKAAAII